MQRPLEWEERSVTEAEPATVVGLGGVTMRTVEAEQATLIGLRGALLMNLVALSEAQELVVWAGGIAGLESELKWRSSSGS